MDAALLARIQFGVTIGFHFLFPPLTIGLAWLIVALLTKHVRTGDDAWRRIAHFWARLFGITFAMGVATGITMEFAFGMNWARYARYVGDIFGAPLAAEVLLAFFLESTFLGVLLVGWDRISNRLRWWSAFLVAAGSTLSAFWIIAAGSWMQTPRGFMVVDKGLPTEHAVLTDAVAAVFNPSMLPRFLHTLDACLLTGAFFMVGISAWLWRRGRHAESARRSLKLGLVVAAVAALVQLPLGHYHAMQVARDQPVKLAAFEGLFTTRTHAPALLFGIPNVERRTVDFAVEIPSGLSWLVHMNPAGEVQGLDKTDPKDWPPLAMTFYPFHLMVMLGMFFIGYTLLGLFLWWRKVLFEPRWYSRLYLLGAMWCIPLPFLANELGWIAAEVGRQPWVVWQMLRTAQATSIRVSAEQIALSLGLFSLVYLLLLVAWIGVLRREVRRGIAKGPTPEAHAEEVTA